jgi:hypothetical protein
MASLLLAIVLIGITLWRSRWTLAVLAGACVVFSGIWLAAWKNESPIVQLEGAIDVTRSGLRQRDLWIYRSALAPAQGSIAADGLLLPYLVSRSQAETTHLMLNWQPDQPRIQYDFHLDTRSALAFCGRSVQPVGSSSSEALSPPTSAFRIMADRFYSGENDLAAGERTEIRSDGSRLIVLVVRAANP